jgi:O-antigen/teichoic acid export membrane protein
VWNFALPLFLFALSLRLFDKLDLFMLKVLGGTATEVGYYGAAQNLTIIPSLFALSFSPLLLSTITRMLRDGKIEQARSLGRDGMRVALWMLPFAGMTAGCSAEVIRAIFGDAFLPSAPVLAVLIFGAVASVLTSISTVILIADGKPIWTFAIAGPLPLIALAGHLIMIPRLGMKGASVVTTVTACSAAIASILVVRFFWRVAPPLKTFGRSLTVSLMAYALASIWATGSGLLSLKLAGIAVAILLGFAILGEFSAREIATVRVMMRGRSPSEPTPGEVS